VEAKYKLWSEEDIDRLKALVTSGASAIRASVILKRSLKQIKKNARELGIPFPSDADLRIKRRQIFQNSVDGPRARVAFRINRDTE
jgi:GcrA cell cycle regulator